MSIVAARPVAERIAVALKDRLLLLTAGYAPSSAIKEVLRVPRFGDFTPKHLQIILTQSDPEELPEFMRPGNPPAIAWSQVFNIRCNLMPSEKDPTPIDEYINTVSADIVRAVTDAGSRWFTFGDLAIDAKWQPLEAVIADGGVDGFNLPLAVIYRVSELDPYTVRA